VGVLRGLIEIRPPPLPSPGVPGEGEELARVSLPMSPLRSGLAMQNHLSDASATGGFGKVGDDAVGL